jgi:hypothetical protein
VIKLICCTWLILSCKRGFLKRYEHYELISSGGREKCKPVLTTCISYVCGTESRVHMWSHGSTLSFRLSSPPMLRFCDSWCRKLTSKIVVSFDLSPLMPRSGSFHPVVPTLRSFESQPERLVTKIPEGRKS